MGTAPAPLRRGGRGCPAEGPGSSQSQMKLLRPMQGLRGAPPNGKRRDPQGWPLVTKAADVTAATARAGVEPCAGGDSVRSHWGTDTTRPFPQPQPPTCSVGSPPAPAGRTSGEAQSISASAGAAEPQPRGDSGPAPAAPARWPGHLLREEAGTSFPAPPSSGSASPVPPGNVEEGRAGRASARGRGAGNALHVARAQMALLRAQVSSFFRGHFGEPGVGTARLDFMFDMISCLTPESLLTIIQPRAPHCWGPLA